LNERPDFIRELTLLSRDRSKALDLLKTDPDPGFLGCPVELSGEALQALGTVETAERDLEAGPKVKDGPFRTRSDVEFATLTWVDWFNHRP